MLMPSTTNLKLASSMSIPASGIVFAGLVHKSLAANKNSINLNSSTQNIHKAQDDSFSRSPSKGGDGDQATEKDGSPAKEEAPEGGDAAEDKKGSRS